LLHLIEAKQDQDRGNKKGLAYTGLILYQSLFKRILFKRTLFKGNCDEV
jgi:hypothetical protein